MKIGFIADIHVANHRRFGGAVEAGINQRCQRVLAALERATKLAAVDCDVLVVLGDLFDNVRPEPQIIAAVQRILGEGPATIVALLGNHEQVSTTLSDHALGPLSSVAKIIETPTVEHYASVELLLVPFRPGPAREWLPDVLSAMPIGKKKSTKRVLALHLGIIAGDTPPWLRDAHDAIEIESLFALCEKHDIHSVFAGNWHERRGWVRDGGFSINQVGALVPTGFDNPGISPYGTLMTFESDTEETAFELIPGPRFVKARTGTEGKAAIALAKKEKHQLYLQCIGQVGEIPNIDGVIIENVPDETEAKAQHAAATSAARSAETLAEALAKYVSSMLLPEDVDRAVVLERCIKYLNA